MAAVDFAMLLVALAWGINAPVIKLSLSVWDFRAFNAIRFTVAALLIFGCLLMTERNWLPKRRDLFSLAKLGLVGSGLYQWLFVEGLARTSAGNAAVIINMCPVVVAVWAGINKFERLTSWVIVGVVLSVAGVILVVFGSGRTVTGGALTGDLMSLGAMLCWSGYAVYARPVMDRVGSALKVTAWAMLFGALTTLAVGFPSLLRQDYGAVNSASLGGLAYSSLIAQGFGYMAYAWGLSRLGGTRTAIYTTLTPLFAALVGWVLLGETWALWQWAGAVLISAGVLLPKMEARSR